jgi:hypothetical protein
MTPSAQTDPVKRPTVKLGDKEYEIKFRLSDLSRLNKDHGIDLFLKSDLVGMAAVERVAIVLSAGIAHSGDGLSPEQIMECIELPELPIYALAIVEAQKKASSESQKASKALAAMVPTKKQPDPSVQ